jgi:hypothetical protein
MIYFVFAVFLSSFLLFQIQPMMGKYILPWFGGTTGVWSASLLFFQTILTGGYAYSYWLIGRLSRQRQGLVHLILLGFSILLLIINTIVWDNPILPDDSWRSQIGSQPLIDVLKVLLVAVGPPYFLLSTNSTLMQAWFIRDQLAGSPYWLYAVSNVGSLVALITFPTLFEPRFSLITQSILWVGVYILFILIAGYQAWSIFHRGVSAKSNISSQVGSDVIRSPKIKQRFMWVGMAALGSILLLATTSRVTQEVAAIPFLWVIPLTVYLLSFILTFSGERWYNRWFLLFLLFDSTVAYLWLVIASTVSFTVQIGIYSVLLFSCTMICHGELYRQRPDPSHLTTFYLMVSIGGAVGGIAVNLVFPYIFKGFWEFQAGLSLVWILMLIFVMKIPPQVNFNLRRLLVVGVAATTCLVIGSLYLQSNTYSQKALETYRNFFGIQSVKEKFPEDPDNHYYVLTHGITTHGYQFLSPEMRTLPTAYYVEDSGVGIGFNYHPFRPGTLRVGLVGLGVGVIAAYGQDGDLFRFYEVNPAVVEIAQSVNFSFLRDTPADVEIVIGDGRISLERELQENGSNNFDMLVLDAFNSDSIPTHLLTLEAFDLYTQHLKPGGILALHISNQHLNLKPIVWQLADMIGKEGLIFYYTSEDIRSKPSLWILLTNNQDFLQNPDVLKFSSPREVDTPAIRLWTDDYSNLFQVLK